MKQCETITKREQIRFWAIIICLFSLTTLQNTLYNNVQRPTVPSSNIKENIIMNTHTPWYSIYMLKDLNAQYFVKWRGSRAVFFVWYTHHRKNVFRAQLYASWVCRIIGYFVQQGKLADLNTVKTIIYVTKVVFDHITRNTFYLLGRLSSKIIGERTVLFEAVSIWEA